MVSEFLGKLASRVEPPRFLFDEKVTQEIYRIIEDAQESLYLVSPYNKHTNHLRNALGDALKRGGLRVELFHRGDEDQREEVAWLKSKGASVFPVRWLHAKIYMNESTALATSMNLLESSFGNSHEFGVRVDRERHGELYNQLDDYVGRLRSWARGSNAAAGSAPAKPPAGRPAKGAPRSLAYEGFCIRCGRDIPLNQERPYCLECYKKWDKNYDHKEHYCHACGKGQATSMSRPRCPVCYGRRSGV